MTLFLHAHSDAWLLHNGLMDSSHQAILIVPFSLKSQIFSSST